MTVRKLKFHEETTTDPDNEKHTLYNLLINTETKENYSSILYEDTLHFYGLWETTLLFFDLKNEIIISPEELGENPIETLGEHNNESSYKMYNLISYNFLQFSPLYLFFYFDGLTNEYINTFVYDTNNPKISVNKIKENFQHLVLDDINPNRIKECIFHIFNFKSSPFLFLHK